MRGSVFFAPDGSDVLGLRLLSHDSIDCTAGPFNRTVGHFTYRGDYASSVATATDAVRSILPQPTNRPRIAYRIDLNIT